MTRADLVTDLKKRIGPGIEVDDGGLVVWINDSYMYMIDEIEKGNPDFFIKASTTPTYTNQQQYDVPTDYERVVKVELYQNGQWSQCLPFPEINKIPILADGVTQGFTSGQPRYYLYANQIGFEPIPQDNAGLIKIWYVYTPNELTSDSSVPAFSKKFHAIINYAAYANYLDQDDQHGAAERMRIQYYKRVQDMVESIHENTLDESKSVTITNGTDLYASDDQI